MAKKVFDEIWGNSRERKARACFAELGRWMAETPQTEMARRQASAEVTFRQLGITFAVYGDDDAAERIIPFDIVPRIFTASEWSRLSAGLVQAANGVGNIAPIHIGMCPICRRWQWPDAVCGGPMRA